MRMVYCSVRRTERRNTGVLGRRYVLVMVMVVVVMMTMVMIVMMKLRSVVLCAAS